MVKHCLLRILMSLIFLSRNNFFSRIILLLLRKLSFLLRDPSPRRQNFHWLMPSHHLLQNIQLILQIMFPTSKEFFYFELYASAKCMISFLFDNKEKSSPRSIAWKDIYFCQEKSFFACWDHPFRKLSLLITFQDKIRPPHVIIIISFIPI